MAPKAQFQDRGRQVVLWGALTFLLLEAGTYFCVPTRGPERRFNEADLTHAPALGDSIIHWQVCHALEHREPLDLVFLGDSSCLMGVMPQLVQDRSGLRAWNYGTIATLSTQGHADVLQLFLRNGKPARVVYYVTGYPLTATRTDIARIGFLQLFRDWAFPAQEESGGLLAWLPSCRLQQFTQARLPGLVFSEKKRQRFLATPRGPYPSDNDTRQILLDNRGFHPDTYPPPAPQDWPALAAQTPACYHQPQLSDDCREGLLRFCRLAAEAPFEFVIMMNPVPEAFRDPSTARAFARLEDDLQSLTASYPRVRICKPLLRYYPNHLFVKAAHLTPAGARQNSLEVAELLSSPTNEYESPSVGPQSCEHPDPVEDRSQDERQ